MYAINRMEIKSEVETELMGGMIWKHGWDGWEGRCKYIRDGKGRADNRDGEHYDTPPPPENRRSYFFALIF